MSMVAALGMEAVALGLFRRATDTASTRAALAAMGATRPLAGFGALALALTGIILATRYWHWQGAWMGLGLLGLVAIGAVGGALTGRVVKRLQKDLGGGPNGSPPADVIPALRKSLIIRTALFIGIVFLMTVKPGTLP